jgi:hypothetical protein
MANIEDKQKEESMPAEDLEQYGVWVKAGPETVKEEGASVKDDFDLSDISGENTEITAEEEDLLSSLEDKSQDEGDPETLGDMDEFSFDSPAESGEALDDDFSFPDIEDIQAGAAAQVAAETAGEDAPPEDDLSLPEEETLSSDGQSLDLDFSMDEPPAGEAKEEFNDIAAAFSMDEPPADEAKEEFNDIAAVEKEMTDSAQAQAESDDITIDLDMPETEEAQEIEEPAPQAAKAPQTEAPEAGMSVLSKIEEELASIKAELAELKKELSGLRVAGSAPAEGAEAHHKISGDSGFFADDEDEDETIALTGDELNNILSTADITEEEGESDVPDDILNFNMEAAEAAPVSDEAVPDLAADAEAPEEAPSGDIDFVPETPEEAVEEGEPEKQAPQFDLSGIDEKTPEDLDKDAVPEGEEIVIDMTDSETEATAESFEDSDNIISLDDTPATAENIPLTTPEEQAIIEEYNRELDNFGSEDLGAESSPENISETIAGEEETAAAEEEAEVEFDLDSLQEPPEEAPEEPAAEEESPEVFEEGLALAETPLSAEEIVPEEEPEEKPAVEAETEEVSATHDGLGMSQSVREEIKSVLKYMDQLLESLPEDKIQEFARSEHFDVYRKLFEELGLE